MRISDWSSDVCSSDLRGSRSGIDRLKPLREPARAPFPIERLIEFARVVRALPVAFALLGPSRYSDAHMHRSHILRSEEHTSELQSLMRISYAVFCLKKKNTTPQNINRSIR